ncbi:MAG: c-type cytochrome [Verrucomicrobiales bacterium]|nr:c-type cytochrome [Verrucomicrobiales bacterium]
MNFVSPIIFGIGLLLSAPFAGVAQPIISGLASSELDSNLKGLILLEEMNCVACHSSDAPFAIRSKKAPRLSEIGSRLNPAYIESFIRDPHGTKPGTTMPDLLHALDAAKRDEAAKAITHFLLSLKPNQFSLQPPDHVAAKEGERLFHSRGCVACHSPRDEAGEEMLRETSAPLGALAGKYSVRSLIEFLRNPHAVRPSGRMPDMRLQGRDAERIAHYLLKDTRVPGPLAYTLYRGQVWEGLDSDTVAAERAGQVRNFALESLGKIQHQTAITYEGWVNLPRPGSYTFFLEMNGGSLALNGKEIVREQPSNRRGPKELKGTAELQAGRRKIELTYFHTGREPRFSLEMEGPEFERQAIPPAMLSVSEEPIAAFEPVQVDADLAARGQIHFTKLGCANCHDDLQLESVPGPAFSSLASGRGCLSGENGPWPDLGLDVEQRNWISEVLPQVEALRLDDRQQIARTMVTFNCIGCHDRTGVGGIAPERDRYFTGTKPELGNQGRLPPTLSHVGAKLKPEWITEVLLRGGRQRDYLEANMPQYGEKNVGHLVELLGRVDTLEEVILPKVSNIRESKDAGYEMIGADGFSCIACHDYNGQKAGGAGALDLVNVTDRLRKNWFHLYMRDPQRFHATVIMPSYWPGGQSIRPNLLEGDPAQQIEALWNYLEDGPRAKKPKGLSRQSNELRVSDVAEICRGRGTAGFRGIGVGYPERLNLAFDSEEMALRLLWKGAFANVNHGSFQARGGDRVSFPPGIPFHRLESMDDSWPYKGKTDFTFPQDQGYQFLGYELDELRRPTFRYRYGEVSVEDFFEDVPEENGWAWFRRTFQFETPRAQEMFYFRASSGTKITRTPDGSFVIDQLELRIGSSHEGLVREGDPAEVLIPLTLPEGRSQLILEYRW